jgi:hypothetical protein
MARAAGWGTVTWCMWVWEGGDAACVAMRGGSYVACTTRWGVVTWSMWLWEAWQCGACSYKRGWQCGAHSWMRLSDVVHVAVRRAVT